MVVPAGAVRALSHWGLGLAAGTGDGEGAASGHSREGEAAAGGASGTTGEMRPPRLKPRRPRVSDPGAGLLLPAGPDPPG